MAKGAAGGVGGEIGGDGLLGSALSAMGETAASPDIATKSGWDMAKDAGESFATDALTSAAKKHYDTKKAKQAADAAKAKTDDSKTPDAPPAADAAETETAKQPDVPPSVAASEPDAPDAVSTHPIKTVDAAPDDGPAIEVSDLDPGMGSLGVPVDRNHVPGPGEKVNWGPNDGGIGEPVLESLPPGTELHRRGSPAGSYFSPERTPIPERSLPPTYSEDGAVIDYTPEEYFYEVGPNGMNAETNAIAPLFNQPGGGLQYQAPKTNPTDQRKPNMNALVDDGRLIETQQNLVEEPTEGVRNDVLKIVEYMEQPVIDPFSWMEPHGISLAPVDLAAMGRKDRADKQAKDAELADKARATRAQLRKMMQATANDPLDQVEPPERSLAPVDLAVMRQRDEELARRDEEQDLEAIRLAKPMEFHKDMLKAVPDANDKVLLEHNQGVKAAEAADGVKKVADVIAYAQGGREIADVFLGHKNLAEADGSKIGTVIVKSLGELGKYAFERMAPGAGDVFSQAMDTTEAHWKLVGADPAEYAGDAFKHFLGGDDRAALNSLTAFGKTLLGIPASASEQETTTKFQSLAGREKLLRQSGLNTDDARAQARKEVASESDRPAKPDGTPNLAPSDILEMATTVGPLTTLLVLVTKWNKPPAENKAPVELLMEEFEGDEDRSRIEIAMEKLSPEDAEAIREAVAEEEAAAAALAPKRYL